MNHAMNASRLRERRRLRLAPFLAFSGNLSLLPTFSQTSV